MSASTGLTVRLEWQGPVRYVDLPVGRPPDVICARGVTMIYNHSSYHGAYTYVPANVYRVDDSVPLHAAPRDQRDA